MSGRSTSLVGLAALALAACGSAHAVSPTCAVDRGELPSWATTGFSDPHPKIAHVVGDAGRITAILFADPLKATSCWTLALSWSGRTDRLSLEYR